MHARGGSGRVRTAVMATSVVVLATILSGCTAGEPLIPPAASPSSAAPTEEPTGDRGVPVLDAEGDAEANLPFFASVIVATWEAGAPVDGRSYVDALTAAGFDKAAMQVTNDLTSLGGPVDSVQFSVLWRDECLIGQVGPAIGEPAAVVMPRVQGGACLIGQTRTIDW